MTVRIFHKGLNIPFSKFINQKEIDCKCKNSECDITLIDIEIVEMFSKLRTALDMPIEINSGYRCTTHNRKVGGQKTSRHIVGQAVDLKCPETISFDDFEKHCKTYFKKTIPYKEQMFIHCQSIA